MEIARQSDWKTEPLPSKRAVIRHDQHFSSEEMAVVRRGVIPEQMEDKWFIYWNDGELYFHRSWTGRCIYVVKFEADQTGCRMIEALANRDPGQYQETSDDRDRAMISFLIDVVLLHRQHDFPSAGSSEDTKALMQWSQVGRAALGEDPKDE
jgi:hypothetical protein